MKVKENTCVVVQFVADFIRSKNHLDKIAFVNHSAELMILPHFEINPGHNYKFQMKLYLERDVYNFSYFTFKGCPKIFNMKSLNTTDESIIKKSDQCDHFPRNSSFNLGLKKGPVSLNFDFRINTPYLDLPIVMQTIFLKSTRNWIEIICNHGLNTNVKGHLNAPSYLNQLCTNKIYERKLHAEMKTEQLVIELENQKKEYNVELRINILTKMFSASQFHPIVKWNARYYFKEQSKYHISVPGRIDYLQVSLTEVSKISRFNHCITFYFQHKEVREYKTALEIAKEEKEDFYTYLKQSKTVILDHEYFVYTLSSKRRKGRIYNILNWCTEEGPELDPFNFMWDLHLNPRHVFLPPCLEREVLFTNLRSWNKVSEICQNFGGHLPYFNDRAEMVEFISLLDIFDKTYPREAVYIGLNYYQSEKVREQIYSKEKGIRKALETNS